MDKIQVAIRARPATDDKVECISLIPEKNQVLLRENEELTFDHVFNSEITQKELYIRVAQPIMTKFIGGKFGGNGCILAYGQTGTGKTFTMGGDNINSEHQGIIPRLIRELFSAIENVENVTHELSISFIEVYNNEVYDLLNEKAKLTARDGTLGTKLNDLTEKNIENADDALKLFEIGISGRRETSTAANAKSSRSHAIFTIKMDIKQQETTTTCRLQMVDLAGSEQFDQSNSKETRGEGISINVSLLKLERVIKALQEKQKYIPFRDSVLTRLLQECLGGGCYTILIACINLASLSETNNTLQFASRVSGIQKKFIPTSARKPATKHFMPPSSARKRTPLKPFNLSESAMLSTISSPYVDALAAKLEKRFLKTPTVNKLAAKLFEKHSMIQIAESTLIPEELTVLSEDNPQLNETEVISGSNQLTAAITSSARIDENESQVSEKIDPLIEKTAIAQNITLPFRLTNLDGTCVYKIVHESSGLHHSTSVRDCCSHSRRRSRTPEKSRLRESSVFKPSSPVSLRRSKRDCSIYSTTSTIRQNRSPISTVRKTRRDYSLLRTSSRNQRRVVENSRRRNTENFYESDESNSTVNYMSLRESRDSLNQSRASVFKSHFNPEAKKKLHDKILEQLNGGVKNLCSLPTIGPKTALSIFNWREINGPFQKLSDLYHVSSLPKHFFHNFAQRNNIDF